MTSDETQIQILADWPMLHVKHVTNDHRKNPEYHVVTATRKLQTDKNCHGQTMLKISRIRDLKRPTAPKVLNMQSKHNKAKDRKRKCCWFM